MKNAIIIFAALAITSTAFLNNANADKRRGGGGGNQRSQMKSNFGHQNHNHKNHRNNNHKWQHKNQNHKWHHNHHNHNHHWNHNYKFKYYTGQKYYYQPQQAAYVQFTNFPYKVCWNQGQYWAYCNNQWMPYVYLIQHHPGAWNWHTTHFHKQNHKHKHNFRHHKHGHQFGGKKIQLKFKK